MYGPSNAANALKHVSPHPRGHCHSLTSRVWVVYATFCNKYSNRLISHVDAAGFPLAVLEHGGPWRGYSGRTRAYHSYLLTLQPDSVAIITDTYDVILQPSCSQSDIVEAFKRQSKPVLFSTEVYCWPDGSKRNQYPSPRPPPPNRSVPKSEYPCLNAGSLIGYVKDLLKSFEEGYTSNCDDDQAPTPTPSWDRCRNRPRS